MLCFWLPIRNRAEFRSVVEIITEDVLAPNLCPFDNETVLGPYSILALMCGNTLVTKGPGTTSCGASFQVPPPEADNDAKQMYFVIQDRSCDFGRAYDYQQKCIDYLNDLHDRVTATLPLQQAECLGQATYKMEGKAMRFPGRIDGIDDGDDSVSSARTPFDVAMHLGDAPLMRDVFNVVNGLPFEPNTNCNNDSRPQPWSVVADDVSKGFTRIVCCKCPRSLFTEVWRNEGDIIMLGPVGMVFDRSVTLDLPLDGSAVQCPNCGSNYMWRWYDEDERQGVLFSRASPHVMFHSVPRYMNYIALKDTNCA